MEKVLFICKSNVGRSQMAEALFNSMAKGKAIAISAGVDPGAYEGKKIADIEIAKNTVVASMKDVGIDVSNCVSKKITKVMIDESNIVVSMVKKEQLPEFARGSKKVTYWDIPNPKEKTYEFHVKVRSLIEQKVRELLDKLNKKTTV